MSAAASPPRRLLILGCAGAGKTTLGARIAGRIGAPFICLDALWRAEWGPGDVPAFRDLVRAAHDAEAWVSDGNFAKATFDLRLPRADLIVWVQPPRLTCAWRALRRPFRPGEAHRPGDLAKVLRFIWTFDRVNRPRIEGLIAAKRPTVPVVRLRTGADAEQFLQGLA